MAKRSKSALNIKPPSLPHIPMKRNPSGWNLSEVTIRKRFPGWAEKFATPEPAGEPPLWWQAQYPVGTKPEWAVWWGLEKNGLVLNSDFYYRAYMPGLTLAEKSQLDFVLPYYRIAIEVQGLYWHYGQGEDKVIWDLLRREGLIVQGYNLIFIDEDHAIENPIYITKEAIAGRDHSRMSTKF